MRIKASTGKTVVLFATALLTTFCVAPQAGRNQINTAIARTESGAVTGRAGAHNDSRLVGAYGNLPLAFEKNSGQTDSRVRFLSHGKGYELFLTSEEAVLALRHPASGSTTGRNRWKAIKATEAASVLRLQLQGANPDAPINGFDKLPGRTDYFVGNDPRNWRTGVPSYSRVKYKGVYHGVDLVFYGTQHRIEYDFVVAPYADPKAIALKIDGGRELRVDRQGNLLIGADDGEVQLEKPVVYQELDGNRREISGSYVLAGNGQVMFDVSAYDRTRPLVIDPVLNYSTYLGGSTKGDVPGGLGIAIDSLGNAYIAGQTFSTTFPMSSTIAGFNAGPPGASTTTGGAVFVTELNPTGTQEVYSTYLSGDGGEAAFGIALDPSGNIYVTGQTFSTNFPATTNALNPGPLSSASAALGHAFVSKINPKVSGLSSLVYSSYLAGNSTDLGSAVAADASGNAYIAGGTMSSSGFPTRGGYLTSLPSAGGNAFLTRIDTTQSTGPASLIYSTYLGGTTGSVFGFTDQAFGVAVDSSNNAYIVGTTAAADFPTTTSAYRQNSQAPSGAANGAVFVSKINTALTGNTSLVYSTYLAGPAVGVGGDFGFAIALGPNNITYVAGQTGSSQFPVFPTAMIGTAAGTFPSPPGGLTAVAFVSKINTLLSGASSLVYSTLLGGSNGDQATGIAADSLGNAYVGGITDSANFPLTAGAYQMTRPNSQGDGFITKLSTSGNGASDLLYSTYFGGSGIGSGSDKVWAIAADSLNDAYVAGQTASAGLATSGALQTTLSAGAAAAFVAKLTLIPTVTVSPSPIAFGNQLIHTTSASQTVTLTNNTGAAATIVVPPTITGTNAADFATTAGTPACTTSLAAGASCAFGVTFTPSTSGSAESATLTITYTAGASGNGPTSQTLSLTGTGTAPTVTLNPTATLNFPTPQPVGTTSAALPVTVTNTGTGNLSFTVAPSTGSTEFVVASGTTCTSSTPVGPTSSCTINITFTPSATGSRSATLTITDSASNSPQTITITGTGTNAVPAVTITPSPVPFGGQLVTTTSAAQAVTVRNTGSSNLNITAAPTVGGTNASDFAIGAGSTCTSNATVAPNGTCVINVTFTPPAAASGSRSAILAIADNAPGSPQQVTLTGTAWDFSLSGQPATVHPGSTATIAVSVTGIGGFTGAVTLSCTAALSCTAPGPVTAPGTGNVTVAAKGFVVPSPSIKKPPVSMHQVIVLTFALMLLFALPATRRFRTRLGLATAAAFLIVISGCSNPLPTPAGTYPVVITGSSGGLSHTITVVMTVD